MNLKVLILSDLNWNIASKKVTRDDLNDLQFSKRKGSGSRFISINKYWSIIETEQPELVLLAGDLTGDGSCGHGFHFAFMYFLSLLEYSKIQTYYIQGDNDLPNYYDVCIQYSKSMEFVREISNKSISYEILKILGLPFQTTNKKKTISRYLVEYRSMHHNILLCHSALKRRTHLFGLNADLIITGHFDNKLCAIQDSVFISLSNDSNIINYVTLEYSADDIWISYQFYNGQRKRRLAYSEYASQLLSGDERAEVLMDKVPINISEFENLILPNTNYEKEKNALALSIKYLRGKSYKAAVNMMLECKNINNINPRLLRKLMNRFFTSKHKLSKSMLIDYLGAKVKPHL